MIVLVERWTDDGCSPCEFDGIVAMFSTEKEADEFIAKAPTAVSIVNGYCYQKRIMEGYTLDDD